MDHAYRTEKQFDRPLPPLTCSNANQGIASAERDASPVEQAINRLRSEISEVHFAVDCLIGRVEPVLRQPGPENASNQARPMGQSKLDETIEQMVENLRSARQRLADATDRLTL